MLAGDGQRDPFAGLGAHGVEHLRVNWSEDLDGECGFERLIVGLRGTFSDEPEMRLHRGGVRVDLNDCHFGAVVIDVLVERDQLGLVLLDELDEARGPAAFGVGASLDAVDALGIAVGKCLTALSADDSREVVAGAMIITAGLWPIANPAARVSATFEKLPALTRARVEFRTRLTSVTRTLIDGLLARAGALD
jgi:hypothetical protein